MKSTAEKIFIETAESHKLINNSDIILAGISGGADSVLLLYMLHTLFRMNKIYAIHVNHGLRGEESDRDEAFVKSLCRKLNIECFSEKISSDYKNNNSGSVEGDLREARYKIFSKYYKKLNADKLALAHNSDDQIETVIFRFLRGSGATGLAGFEVSNKIKGMQIIRPMINISKKEVLKALKHHNLDWKEDSSNKSDKYTRNRIRKNLLPYLEKNYNPNIRETIHRTARIFYDLKSTLQFTEEYFFTASAEKINDDILLLHNKELKKYPPSVRSLVFRYAIQKVSCTEYPPEESMIRILTAEWEKKKYPLIVKISGNLTAIIKKNGIYLWKTNLPRKTSAENILFHFNEKMCIH